MQELAMIGTYIHGVVVILCYFHTILQSLLNYTFYHLVVVGDGGRLRKHYENTYSVNVLFQILYNFFVLSHIPKLFL